MFTINTSDVRLFMFLHTYIKLTNVRLCEILYTFLLTVKNIRLCNSI